MAGEFLCCLKKEVAADPESGQPPGTRSLILGLIDRQGRRLCVVHMFFTPSGTIGGSGLPDPKEIVDDRYVYRVYKLGKQESP
jgi:hypothetical protein